MIISRITDRRNNNNMGYVSQSRRIVFFKKNKDGMRQSFSVFSCAETSGHFEKIVWRTNDT